ncbi:MAG: ABC transporter permease [Muribaculaceae bacterium]|nr:ABC transporter permease [Muribaculaceae bacterium]
MTDRVKHSKFFLWCIQVLRVCGRELLLVFRDEGVVIFFLLLNAVYPVLYALIYNTEVVRNERVVVVDDNRTALSRDFTRRLDATQEIAIAGYAANMQEAQEAMHRKECYGIVYFPRDFAQSVTRGEQGHVSLYCDMSVMMRYKAMFTALSNVSQAMGNEKMGAVVEPVLNMSGAIVENRQVAVGNPAMGIASAVLLFILPLVLQQSMILGIAMLHGGSIERRRRNGGRDPMAIEACSSATVIGKMMCHQIIYVLPVIYVLHYIPLMFGFPQYGNLLHIICLAVPFVIAVSFMGQTLQAFVNERESVFLLFVFSSVVFVFLTGVSWPRYLMSRLWRVVGDCVPATWMVNGYVLMQTNGATLYQVQHEYWMLWLQVPVLFTLAYMVERYVNRRRYRSWIAASEDNPNVLTRIELAKNGVG